MTADWKQYIDISEYLLKAIDAATLPANEEMICRCIISRVYYAAFCTVRDAAEKKGVFVVTKKAADHGRLANLLRDKGDVGIAENLMMLRQLRNTADYDSSAIINHDDAQLAIEQAKEICANTNHISQY